MCRDSIRIEGNRGFQAKPGDQVIAIDDEEIGGQSMAEVMKRVSCYQWVCGCAGFLVTTLLRDVYLRQLKGPVGSEVKITFLREGNAEDIEFDALITRTESEFQDVQVRCCC